MSSDWTAWAADFVQTQARDQDRWPQGTPGGKGGEFKGDSLGVAGDSPVKRNANGTNPLVKLSDKQERVALMTEKAYRNTGRYGSTQTIYGYVHKIESHPFKKGDKIRIGRGKQVWTADTVSGQHVSLVAPRTDGKNQYRTFQYDQVARLFPE